MDSFLKLGLRSQKVGVVSQCALRVAKVTRGVQVQLCPTQIFVSMDVSSIGWNGATVGRERRTLSQLISSCLQGMQILGEVSRDPHETARHENLLKTASNA